MVQAAREVQEARILHLTLSCQQLGAQLVARDDALSGALSRLNIADFLLQTAADGDPARVPAACLADDDPELTSPHSSLSVLCVEHWESGCFSHKKSACLTLLGHVKLAKHVHC